LRQSETTGSGTTQFTWGPEGSLPLLLSDGANSYIYGPDGTPIEQISSGGTPTYLLADQLGSTRALTNSSGSVTATFSYDPWGNLTGSTGSATTPFMYAGTYLDSSTGLYYMQARYYDPATGEFLSVDPAVAQTDAPFNYAGDDPVNGVDPSGLSPDETQCTSVANGQGPGPLTSQEAASGSANACKSELTPAPPPCPLSGTASSAGPSRTPTQTSTSVEVTCTTNPNCYSGGYGNFWVEVCFSFVVGQVCLAAAQTDTFLTYGPGLSFSPPGASISIGAAEYGSSCSIMSGWSHSAGAGYDVGGGWAQSSSAGGPYISFGWRGWADSFYTYGHQLTGGEC
jgi:RHS repeat-associated protein